jgi:hypothetical protein
MRLNSSFAWKTIFARGKDRFTHRRSFVLRKLSPSVRDISGDVLQGLQINGPHLGIDQ